MLTKGRKVMRYLMMTLMAIFLCGMSVTRVEAKGDAEQEQPIIVEDFDEIQEEYHGSDGKYVQYLDEELIAEYNIDSSIELGDSRKRFGISTFATNYTLTRTLNTSVSTKSGTLIWRSSITGKFGYNNKYVWGKSKSNSFSTDVGSTRTITKNSLTTGKTTDKAYYYLNSTIRTKKYETYYLEQCVYGMPGGGDGVRSAWRKG